MNDERQTVSNIPVADLHIHTVASGHAFSTVGEIISSAKENGMKLIAITDHGPALPGGAHLYHFWNTRVLPDSQDGVRILKGAEANIIGPDGEIDLPLDLLGHLDIVLVALHIKCGYEGETKEDNTETLIKAIEKHHINVIAHPGNPLFPIDFDKLCEKAKEKNVAIEFNNSSYTDATSRSGSYDLDVELAKAVKRHKNAVVLGSDAHIASDVGKFDRALKLLDKAGIEKQQILNYSTKEVLEFLNNS